MTARASRTTCGPPRGESTTPGYAPRPLDHQPYPRTGPLARRRNPDLETLRARIGAEEATVYSYVVATIEQRDGRFVQRGTAPNWQGGILTLATCKQRMRTFRDPDEWAGVWLAGFTGIRAGDGANALVFLTRVSFAASSTVALWRDTRLPDAARWAKDATRHPLGDLYRPAGNRRGQHNSRAYVAPCPEHPHAPGGEWRCDIEYQTAGGRRPASLIGDPQHTYLYDRPLIWHERRDRPGIGRGQRKDALGNLLDRLRTTPGD